MHDASHYYLAVRSVDHSTSRDSVTLVFNAGSSSLKVALLDFLEPARIVAWGTVQSIGSERSSISLTQSNGSTNHHDFSCPDHRAALSAVVDGLDELLGKDWFRDVRAVGHRVVNGGVSFTRPTRLTASVERALAELADLAPLHNTSAVVVAEGAIAALPHAAHVACFDTMFHVDLPPEAARYALPHDLTDRLKIRRYGFHGLSCTWAMSRLSELGVAGARRVIICHLGAGASVTAVLDGHSLDTTMGFTPLEGLIMATRSGSIDPSIILYLQRHAGMGIDDVEHLLEREAGLLGLSGESGDVRILEQRAQEGVTRADQALAAFAYRVRTAIGAFWAALGGLDVLVFTGGIGENAPGIRARILEPLSALGVRIEQESNDALHGGREGCLNPDGRHPAVLVIPAREDLVIALQVRDLLTSTA